MNVGISDDSMSQATENRKPSKKIVSLTVDQGSESSGGTVFYEDPTAQAQEMDRAAASSSQPPPSQATQPMQVVPAMPEVGTEEPTIPVTIELAPTPVRLATPILPFTGTNPAKRSGNEDIERERPARTRTPSQGQACLRDRAAHIHHRYHKMKVCPMGM